MFVKALFVISIPLSGCPRMPTDGLQMPTARLRMLTDGLQMLRHGLRMLMEGLQMLAGGLRVLCMAWAPSQLVHEFCTTMYSQRQAARVASTSLP